MAVFEALLQGEISYFVAKLAPCARKLSLPYDCKNKKCWSLPSLYIPVFQNQFCWYMYLSAWIVTCTYIHVCDCPCKKVP